MKEQFTIPEHLCFSCDICCRFPEKESFLAPYFSHKEISQAISYETPSLFFNNDNGTKIDLIPNMNGYICPCFSPKSTLCKIYDVRPLDCSIYPFALMVDNDRTNIVLGVDLKCPFIRDDKNNETINNYAKYLTAIIESDTELDLSLVNRYQDDVIIINTLPELSRRHSARGNKEYYSQTCKGFSLKDISIEDKPVIESYFKKEGSPLSSHSFNNIFIWKDLFKYFWKIINERLFLFAEYDGIYYMPIPPVGEGNFEQAVREAFNILGKLNNNNPSRIENIPPDKIEIFQKYGYQTSENSPDYIYDREDLISLRGNRYKGKRSSYNKFIKSYKYNIESYSPNYLDDCLNLFSKWKRNRFKKYNDPVYRAMIEDSFSAHRTALNNFNSLNLTGRIVKINGILAGYIIGYELDSSAFCILGEICDLDINGLPQFIFREFLKELNNKWINVMDDSGLENLKRTKLSYYPANIVKSFIATKT